MDLSDMETYDWLVGIGGVVMLISAFFHFSGTAFAFPLGAIGLIVLVVLDKIVHVEQVSDWPFLSILYIIVGAVGALFGVLNLLLTLSWHSTTVLGIHISFPITWYITPILAFAASVLVLAGGIMRKRDVDVGGGGRVARPPAGYQQPYQQPYQPPQQQQPYQQPPPQQAPYQPPQQQPYQPPPQPQPYQPPPVPPQGGPGQPPPPPTPGQWQ